MEFAPVTARYQDRKTVMLDDVVIHDRIRGLAADFDGGASHTAPNPTPRKGVTAIMLRIRLRRYRDALGKNNSAARPPNVARSASSLAARGRTQPPLTALRDRQPVPRGKS